MHMPSLARCLLPAALLLLVACAKPADDAPPAAVVLAPEPPPQAGSCLTQAIGVCQDFHGPGHSANEVQSTCNGQRLVYGRGACPLEDRIGTCELFTDQPVASRLRYYSRFAPGPDGARAQCEEKLRGRWLAG